MHPTALTLSRACMNMAIKNRLAQLGASIHVFISRPPSLPPPNMSKTGPTATTPELAASLSHPPCPNDPRLCFSAPRLFLSHPPFTVSPLSSFLISLLHHLPSIYIDTMGRRRHGKAMEQTTGRSAEYYKEMEAELDILTLTQRVYKQNTEDLQSWIKYLWDQ